MGWSMHAARDMRLATMDLISRLASLIFRVCSRCTLHAWRQLYQPATLHHRIHFLRTITAAGLSSQAA